MIDRMIKQEEMEKNGGKPEETSKEVSNVQKKMEKHEKKWKQRFI